MQGPPHPPRQHSFATPDLVDTWEASVSYVLQMVGSRLREMQ